MQISLTYNREPFSVDLSKPIDISIPLSDQDPGVRCFYAPPFKTEPYVAGDFVGSVKQGAPVNFYNVSVNPHGNGTHTECMGHISDQGYSVNRELKQFHTIALLISITPKVAENGDLVISEEILRNALKQGGPETLIIRTSPNNSSKRNIDYSGTNPTYFQISAMEFIVSCGIKHLLVDLPSVDREEDGGALAAHKVFWNYPNENRLDCTITELIHVPDHVKDGLYFLNMMIAPFDMDASPAKPVLYDMIKEIDG